MQMFALLKINAILYQLENGKVSLKHYYKSFVRNL